MDYKQTIFLGKLSDSMSILKMILYKAGKKNDSNSSALIRSRRCIHFNIIFGFVYYLSLFNETI